MEMNLHARSRRRLVRLGAPVLGLCAVLSDAVASPAWRSRVAEPQTMTCRAALSFKSVSGLLSPSGETVLYVVQSVDLEKNETLFSAWKIPFTGGEAVQLTRESSGDRQFRWSPDSRHVSFLGERMSERGLFLINPEGGEPDMLFSHGEGISQYEWGPDSRRIAFISPGGPSDEEKSAKTKQNDVIIEGRNQRVNHIWIFDLDTDRKWPLTSGTDFTVLSLAWSPDGKFMAFAAAPSANSDDHIKSDIYRIPVEPPEKTSDEGVIPAPARPVKLTVNSGEDTSPQYTPDGRFIVYRSRPRGDLVGGYRTLRIPVTGGIPEDISPRADISSGALSFDPEGRVAYFAGISGVETDLYRMSLRDRIPVPMTTGQGVRQRPSFSADLKRCVFTFQDPLHPQELFAYSTSSGDERRLTDLNGQSVSGLNLSRTEIVRWRSSDGLMIEGLLVHPPGGALPTGDKHPLIVDIHGGPAGLYLLEFDPEVHYLTARGFYVFRPNFRGSAGYGEAFRRADVGDWGGGDFRDVMTGIETVLGRRDIDRDKVGIMGWSFGGYMTAWAISQSPLFKAAVVGAGMVDHLLMWGTQDSPIHYAAYFGGTPFEKGLDILYRERSPLTYIGKIGAPVLILHGENDKRVPASQALLFYNALRAKGATAELVWYPRTGHSPQEPGLRLDIIQRRAAWFSYYLLGKDMAQ